MPWDNLRWSVRNWRDSEASTGRKLNQVVRNNVRKARTRKDCCGNHGEPGC